MDHVRGTPNHPQTQGKIELWHQTLKNVHRDFNRPDQILARHTLMENYYLKGELEATITTFVERYNYRRNHVSLGKLTPADVYSGRSPAILEEREKIKA
jgi:transposase InsO family protein